MPKRDPSELTESQQRYYDLMVRLQKELGRFPRVKELQIADGRSSRSCCDSVIKILLRKGWLKEVGEGTGKGYLIMNQPSPGLPANISHHTTVGSVDHMGRSLQAGATQVVDHATSKIVGYWRPAELLEGSMGTDCQPEDLEVAG